MILWLDCGLALTLTPSLDYIFQVAVEMHKLGIPWTQDKPSSTANGR